MTQTTTGAAAPGLTPAQKDLIERARKNGGLLPTRGYNIQTLQILRNAGLIRPGALREDFSQAESEHATNLEQAKSSVECGRMERS